MKNLQCLTTELYKVKNGVSPEIMKNFFVFQVNETFNLKNGINLARKNIRRTQYEIESISKYEN